MKRLVVSVAMAIMLAGGREAAFSEQTNDSRLEYKKSAGPYAVDVVRYDWVDQKRDRKVPVKIYYPKTGDGPFPVIVFSHGLGGSREGYEYLGRYWASHGYVSAHVQHLGSDNAVWENKPLAEIGEDMRKAAANLTNASNRPPDISFAIDQLERMNREEDSPLKGRLALDKIGVAGHSFGAFTTLAIAGESFPTPNGRRVSKPDPRVKAVIAMSAPVTKGQRDLDAAFAKIAIPCLHMTGTRDSSPIGETRAEDRRVPFDHIKRVDQFLITFKDGDHMIFSGRGRMRGGEKDEFFQTYIKMSSTAFWDAYLQNNVEAKAWLSGGGFTKALGDAGKFEKKVR
jgi:predicted dienelactone hydrolase